MGRLNGETGNVCLAERVRYCPATVFRVQAESQVARLVLSATYFEDKEVGLR